MNAKDNRAIPEAGVSTVPFAVSRVRFRATSSSCRSILAISHCGKSDANRASQGSCFKVVC